MTFKREVERLKVEFVKGGNNDNLELLEKCIDLLGAVVRGLDTSSELKSLWLDYRQYITDEGYDKDTLQDLLDSLRINGEHEHFCYYAGYTQAIRRLNQSATIEKE